MSLAHRFCPAGQNRTSDLDPGRRAAGSAGNATAPEPPVAPGLESGSIKTTQEGFVLRGYGITPGLTLSGKVIVTTSLTGPIQWEGTLEVAGVAGAAALDVEHNTLTRPASDKKF